MSRSQALLQEIRNVINKAKDKNGYITAVTGVVRKTNFNIKQSPKHTDQI